MPSSDTKQADINEPLTDLLHSSQKMFGELLRQICELSGFTQGKLSREAKREHERLIEVGEIPPGESTGSMEQPTISKVITGTQSPTYYQVYIWLKVIKEHFNSHRFAAICEELELPLPIFKPEWEQALWRLANFIPPDELRRVYEDTKDIKLIEIYSPLKIHPPLIDHKEKRWDRAEREAMSKSTNKGRRSVSKTASTRKVTSAK